MKPVLRIAGLLSLITILALCGAELAGWPGLAPAVAAVIAPGLGLSLDPGTRTHLFAGPRLHAPSLTVVHQGQQLALARDLDLRWRWTELWAWYRDGEPLRLSSVQADTLDLVWSRDAAGRSNWQTGAPRAAQATPLPVIETLLIRQGSAQVDDAPLQLKADARFSTGEDGQWRADVDGVLRGQHLALQAQASAGLALLSAPRDNPPAARLRATLSQERSRIQFDGTATSLLDARALDGRIDVSGPSLAGVGRPLGLTLPATPPFQVQGRLQHANGLWSLNQAQARIGRSQLGGDFLYDTRTARSQLRGELRGGPLLLADLGPAVGTDTRPTRPGRLLPDRALDIPSLALMDATLAIRLNALDLGSRALAPLAPVRARLELRNGELSLRGLEAGVAGGMLSGEAVLNARVEPPQWRTDLSVNGVALERWLRKTDALTGILQARLRVQGQGRSIAALLASLDGDLSVALQDGHMSHLATELAELDLAQGLGVWLRGDDWLALDCARFEGRLRSGVLQPRFAVVDNRESRIEVSGHVSLASEELSLRAFARPKDFSPMTLRAPLRVQGTLADPLVALEGKALGGRALAAVALGMLAPPASLLAFVDPGESLPPLSCTRPARARQSRRRPTPT